MPDGFCECPTQAGPRQLQQFVDAGWAMNRQLRVPADGDLRVVLEAPIGATIFVALPGLAWVEIKATAEEVGGGLEVFGIAVATSPTLDGHEFAVDAFGHGVGNA